MTATLADLFDGRSLELQAAFASTTPARHGWTYRDVAQYCYAAVQRRARVMLQEPGALPRRAKHRNGAK